MLVHQQLCRACIARVPISAVSSPRPFSSTPSNSAQPIPGFAKPPVDSPFHDPFAPIPSISAGHDTLPWDDAVPPPMLDYIPSDAEVDNWATTSTDFGSPSGSRSQLVSPTVTEITKMGPVTLGTSEKRRRKGMSRNVMLDLPPLPWSDEPAIRHNARNRALSRMRMAELRRGIPEAEMMAGAGAGQEGKKRWFPQLERRRVSAEPGRLKAGQLFHTEVQRYKEHFLPLLQAEFDEEERVFNARLATWPLEKLKKMGFALDGLSGVQRESSNASVTVQFLQLDMEGRGSPLPYHIFTPGTRVFLSRRNPVRDVILSDGTTVKAGVDGKEVTGQIKNVTKTSVRVVFSKPIPDIRKGVWRLDEGLSDWSFMVQDQAIRSLESDPIAQQAQDVPIHAGRSPTTSQYLPEETILTGTALRDKLLRAFQTNYTPFYPSDTSTPAATTPDGLVHSPSSLKPDDLDAIPIPTPAIVEGEKSILADNKLIQSWTKRYRATGKAVRVEGDPEIGLNDSQMRAMAMMLSERLSLVQGPPGTGKTRVIIETIKLLKKHWEIPHPILVTAHTNVAIDNLLSGLTTHGIKALRVGQPQKVREGLHEHILEAQLEKHPFWEQVVKLRDERQDIYQNRVTTGKFTKALKLRTRVIRAELAELTRVIYGDVLNSADVICTTCLSTSTSPLRHIDFPIVFLDEASMATEPLTLVPLMKGSSHVAIIGDHKQLPPVIKSDEGHAGGLAISMFERLIHERQVPSIMLDTQYRMHPQISAFPAKAFYASLLKDGTTPDRLEPPETSFLPKDEAGNRMNVGFVPHNQVERPVERSIMNEGDVNLVCDIIADLLIQNPNLKASDIGVISPYSAQIRALHNALNSDYERIDSFRAALGDERVGELGEIEIKTVDGFEGREKEVIIFSTVRSNERGYIGFLADWRRLNVGITRAKRALIMVGSIETLEQARTGPIAAETLPQGGGDVWKEFMEYLKDQGMIVYGD